MISVGQRYRWWFGKGVLEVIKGPDQEGLTTFKVAESRGGSYYPIGYIVRWNIDRFPLGQGLILLEGQDAPLE